MPKLLKVGADQLSVEDSGGDGPPLVLLHPGIADKRCWDQVWGPLTETYRVIRFDVRGYGESPVATEKYDWVSDLLAVMDHAGINSAHLVGNSNGGATALTLAMQRPERVRSLVLLAPGISGFDYPPEPAWEARAAELDLSDADAVVDFMLDLWCGAGQDSFVRELVARSATIDESASELWQPLAEVWDSLPGVDAATVVMVGDLDPASMIAGCEAAAERMPNAALIRIPGVDHLPQLRVPELVIDTIRSHCR